MSVRSELYKFVKAILMGGTFTDYMGVAHTFTGISEIKEMRFFNSNLTNSDNNVMRLPCVLFELQETPRQFIERTTSQVNSVASSVDSVTFSLHVVYSKINHDKEDPYLDAMDLGEKIYLELQRKKCAGISAIRKSNEIMDVNSSVMLDYVVMFETTLRSQGTTGTTGIDSEDYAIQIQIGNV